MLFSSPRERTQPPHCARAILLTHTANLHTGKMSSALVWELVKNHNCFMKSNLNGTLLSAEAGNLYNKHSYKFSGALLKRKLCFTEQQGSTAALATYVTYSTGGPPDSHLPAAPGRLGERLQCTQLILHTSWCPCSLAALRASPTAYSSCCTGA
jgi:hypothetical protein